MEEIKIIRYEKEGETYDNVFIYGFAHDWQSLIQAITIVQSKTIYPVKIEKFDDIFIISTNFIELKRGQNDNK